MHFQKKFSFKQILLFKANFTLEVNGSQRVPRTTTGSEKARVSVAFAASASGQKLPPLILIPRKNPLKDFTPPSNVRVVYGTSGTFNHKIIEEQFLTRMVKQYRINHDLTKVHLVWDQSTSHTSKEVTF